jgi:flagellar hook assembly protein FlgD
VDCYVSLQIWDVLGRKVVTLVDEYQRAGYKTAHWNSRNEDGSSISSGIYLYRLESGSYVEIKKMVVMK